MDKDHKGNVEALKESLKDNAQSGSNTIVRPKDAGYYAESLQKVLDEAFDKDAQSNSKA